MARQAFSDASACSSLDTVADCAAAAAASGCVWDSNSGTCSLDPAAAGPFSLVPRLFNDLTFPYFVLTGFTAAVLVLTWTPLWPVIVAAVVPVATVAVRPLLLVWRELSGANYRVAPDAPDRADLDAAAACAAEEARLAARPSYERAVRERMFGNFPDSYDLTRISPSDEVRPDAASISRERYTTRLSLCRSASRRTKLIAPTHREACPMASCPRLRRRSPARRQAAACRLPLVLCLLG